MTSEKICKLNKNENATHFSAWTKWNEEAKNKEKQNREAKKNERKHKRTHCVLAVILAIWKIEIKILDKHDKVENKDT